MKLDTDLQQIRCLGLAVAGTNGKSTTAGLLERMLQHNQRRTLICGPESRPVGAVVDSTAQLDYLIVQLDSFQLQRTEFFRPAVAVLLNVAADHLDAYRDWDSYVRAYGPLFRNQHFFDWAIIQSQALSKLRELQVPVPAKTITFSATDPGADLFLDRGLLSK